MKKQGYKGSLDFEIGKGGKDFVSVWINDCDDYRCRDVSCYQDGDGG